MSTLLDIATRVSRRLPLSSDPTSVVGNTDPQMKLMLELIQEEGDELTARHTWRSLEQDFVFTVSSNAIPFSQTLPPDYTRLTSSVWRSGSQLTPLSGPVGPDAWHVLLTLPASWPGYWRMADGGIQILGVNLGEQITFQYYTNFWILDVNGATTKAAFTADTDTPSVPFPASQLPVNSLMVDGVRWRWKQNKGLDYAEDMETYERNLELWISRDRAPDVQSMARTIKEVDMAKFTWPGTITPLSQ